MAVVVAVVVVVVVVLLPLPLFVLQIASAKRPSFGSCCHETNVCPTFSFQVTVGQSISPLVTLSNTRLAFFLSWFPSTHLFSWTNRVCTCHLFSCPLSTHSLTIFPAFSLLCWRVGGSRNLHTELSNGFCVWKSCEIGYFELDSVACPTRFSNCFPIAKMYLYSILPPFLHSQANRILSFQPDAFLINKVMNNRQTRSQTLVLQTCFHHLASPPPFLLFDSAESAHTLVSHALCTSTFSLSTFSLSTAIVCSFLFLFPLSLSLCILRPQHTQQHCTLQCKRMFQLPVAILPPPFPSFWCFFFNSPPFRHARPFMVSSHMQSLGRRFYDFYDVVPTLVFSRFFFALDLLRLFLLRCFFYFTFG